MKGFELMTMDRRKALRTGLRTAAIAGLFAATAMPAFAQLNRVGPVGPFAYPAWYQDKTGLTLEFCDNQTQAELAGGWCVLLPADLPTGAAPETRIGSPVNFPNEHFYYLMNAGNAAAAIPGKAGVSTRVALVAAVEGAFGGGPVKAGDEMVFARLRIRIGTLPYSGTYTVYTPFGKRVFENQNAGDRLFTTEDVGLSVGNFQQALNGSIYPFVVPSAVAGGPELPPVSASNPAPDQDPAHFAGGTPSAYPGNGRRYIADPARIGPVTGSVADFTADGIPNPNIFRIDMDGPDVPGGHQTLYETFDFGLAGRIYEGAMPGQVTLDRASYARNAAAGDKLDVYATATPITSGRVPASPSVPPIPSSLVYYNGACVPTIVNGNPGAPYSKPATAVPVPMLNSGTTFFAAYSVLPAGMAGCLEANATTTDGQATKVYSPVLLTDQLTISQAAFDAAAQTLTVRASSSDAQVGFDGTTPLQTLTVRGFGNLVNGQLVVNQLLAAPSTVVVTSSGGGSNTYQVSTGTPAPATGTGTGTGTGDTPPPAPVAPVASNVAAATLEDTAVPITITSDPTETITLISTGVIGTAVISSPGTVTFTPNPNASGIDAFAFTLTKDGLTSNTATVTVSITPVNDPPVAVAETVSAINGVAASINLLSNDIDPDGAADLAGIVIDSADARLGAISVSGGVVTFTAAANAGTVTVPLTYYAVDRAGARSASVTSSVRLSGTETISPVKWQYTVSQNRWVVSGTVNPNMGQTMTVSYASGTYNVWNTATSRFVCTAAAGTVVGSAVTDGTATWTFDQPGTAPNSIFNPTNSNNNATSPTGSRTNFWCQTPSVKITSSATGNSVTPGAVQVK
jgi:cadherin-like protein